MARSRSSSRSRIEAADLVGWQAANDLLPSIVPVLTTAIGREEMDSWRHPIDLVALAERALRDVPEALRAGRTQRGSWHQHAPLGRAVLDEDPEAILQTYFVEHLQRPGQPGHECRYPCHHLWRLPRPICGAGTLARARDAKHYKRRKRWLS